ncbi:MAG: His-Xaa-Ser system radical SAM maturase HxsB [Elusimicrobiota bacterium]
MRVPAPPKIDDQKVGFFRFRKVGGKYVLTNDTGQFARLTQAQFAKFLGGKLKSKDVLHQELRAKGFIRDFMDFDKTVEAWSQRHSYLMQGPNLHIIVVTLRCDHACTYCQTSSAPMDRDGLDMTQETAKKTVDTAFETPNPAMTIEFQGGEPLANWPVVKYIVEYALKKNKEKHKTLMLNLVSNLSLMDDKKLKFLLDKGVNICTSLDGPQHVHNANRILRGGNSHANVIAWFKKIKKLTKGKPHGIDALMTTTRLSLKYPEEIIDEYVRLGARGIYLRGLSPFGFAKKTWDVIGYSADEYLEFYTRALDHIFKLNKKKRFFEQHARLYAAKILKNEEPNFLDQRDVCGAGIGQIAYNYDGRVFTCDEGRMLAQMSDEAFKIGDVNKDTYGDMINHATVRACASASCLDNNAECSSCAYKPYCGTCPVENYFLQGDLFLRAPLSGRCRIYKGQMDYFFKKMEDPWIVKTMKSWTRVPSGLYQRD